MTRRHSTARDHHENLAPTREKPFAVQLEERMEAARGNEADAAWLAPAIMEFMGMDVRRSVVREAVEEAAARVAEADRSPEELLGSARFWAQNRIVSWEKEGAPVFDPRPTFDGREVLVWGLGVGAGLALLFGLSALLTGRWIEDFTPGMLLAPGLLGIAILAVVSVWQWALHWWGFWRAGGVVVLLLILLTALLVGVFMATNSVRMPAVALWWIPDAAVWAVVAWGLARLWPGHPDVDDDAVETDDGGAGVVRS